MPLRMRLVQLARRALFLLCLAYLGVLVLFVGLQRRLIYGPDPRLVMPQEVGLDPARVEQLYLDVAPQTRLQGWWCRAQHGRSSERIVLLFPGNAGHRGYRAAIIEQWNRQGCDVVIFDYRGYGGSSGKPSEAAFTHDAIAAWEFLNHTHSIDADQIILCGQSLGGGVATRLAWDLQHRQITPAGLILRATFTSLVDAGRYHYRWLPVDLLLVDRYPSIERIPEVGCPLLVLHGQRDEIVPFTQGEQLFQAAPAKSHNGVPKTFVPLPNAGHNDIMRVHALEVAAAHEKFLASLPSIAPR